MALIRQVERMVWPLAVEVARLSPHICYCFKKIYHWSGQCADELIGKFDQGVFELTGQKVDNIMALAPLECCANAHAVLSVQAKRTIRSVYFLKYHWRTFFNDWQWSSPWLWAIKNTYPNAL